MDDFDFPADVTPSAFADGVVGNVDSALLLANLTSPAAGAGAVGGSSSAVEETANLLLRNLTHGNISFQQSLQILCSAKLPNYSRPSLCDIDLPPSASDVEMAYLKSVVGVVVPILFGLIVVVGLFGNSLVVLVVAANQQMRSTTNILIFNLALADLLFIIFCVPFTATDYALPSWPFGVVWCKIVQYLVIVTAYASVYTLVFMSIDRYLAVVHPIASMAIRNERNAYWAILLLWAVICLACLPAMMAHGLHLINPSSTDGPAYVCIFLKEDRWNWPGFQISFFVTSYVIPLSTICCLYLIMLRKLWFGVGPAGHTSSESVRGKRRVTRLVIIVVASFAVCWCPIQIILVLKSLDAYTIDMPRLTAQIVSHVLAYMNSCINPILYAFLSDNFRKAFLKLMYCNHPPARFMAGRRNRMLRDGTNAGATQNGRDATNMNNAIELDRTNTTRIIRKSSSPPAIGTAAAAIAAAACSAAATVTTTSTTTSTTTTALIATAAAGGRPSPPPTLGGGGDSASSLATENKTVQLNNNDDAVVVGNGAGNKGADDGTPPQPPPPSKKQPVGKKDSDRNAAAAVVAATAAGGDTGGVVVKSDFDVAFTGTTEMRKDKNGKVVLTTEL